MLRRGKWRVDYWLNSFYEANIRFILKVYASLRSQKGAKTLTTTIEEEPEVFLSDRLCDHEGLNQLSQVGKKIPGLHSFMLRD